MLRTQRPEFTSVLTITDTVILKCTEGIDGRWLSLGGKLQKALQTRLHWSFFKKGISIENEKAHRQSAHDCQLRQVSRSTAVYWQEVDRN